MAGLENGDRQQRVYSVEKFSSRRWTEISPHYSRPRQRDTRGQRLEQMSAVSGCEFVVYRIGMGVQLTCSLGGESGFTPEEEFFNRIDPLQTLRLSVTGRSEVEKRTFAESPAQGALVTGHGLARRALPRTSRQRDPMSSPNRSTSPQVYAAPAPALLDSPQGASMKKYILGLVALCILAGWCDGAS